MENEFSVQIICFFKSSDKSHQLKEPYFFSNTLNEKQNKKSFPGKYKLLEVLSTFKHGTNDFSRLPQLSWKRPSNKTC